jgi:hypothetical protein
MKPYVTRMGVILDQDLNGVEFLPILLVLLAILDNSA